MARARASSPEAAPAVPGPEEDAAGRQERKGERTRRRILEAARRVFARVGYEGATIRGIAAEARVDKSSVIQYFGSKQELFRAAVYWEIPFDRLTDPDPARTVENHVRGMLQNWAADPDSPMAVLLRAGMTSEDAADILRSHIGEKAIGQFAAAFPGRDARLRAALAGAILMGVASQRYLLRMPDLAEADPEQIISLLTPLLHTLLAGDGTPS